MAESMVSKLLADVPVPRMFRARQDFPRTAIPPERIRDEVFRELDRPEINARLLPGRRIAITAGSRGIRNVALITKAVVDYVRSRGAEPFLVPAMGSHGGATAEGQREVLASYGITEGSMGCKILASMDTVRVGTSSRGKAVYMDRYAYESDGIIVSCRIKPHNAFRGPVESGVCKMLTVGLGKQQGASVVHSDGMNHMAENIPTMAEVVLSTGRVIAAIPCLENAYDETMKIESILPEDILRREPELLKEAFRNMPSLLVGEGDVLVVDEIGKNYSGSGVDPNITGTFSTPYASGGIRVQHSAFLDLSEESHGNGLGVGLCTAITSRLYNKLDFEKMYPNCITSRVVKSIQIPFVLPTDKEALQLCLRMCVGVDPASARVVRIPNSLHVDRIMLSEAYYQDVLAGRYPGLSVLDEPAELEFDPEGTLLTPIHVPAGS